MKSIIVFSHLRWNFVFQRPQHLMTRLAKTHRVFFFEEPVHDPGPAWLEVESPAPDLLVCRPHTPIDEGGFNHRQFSQLKALLEIHLSAQEVKSPVAWFYTPMALPLLQVLDASSVVYDCMDELSAFLGAPRELLLREQELLKVADVVFTGGPSLFRAKQVLHPNVHNFPSSVEKEHFARARGALSEHPAQRGLPHPRLGFYGVIDERFDPVSVSLLADAHPDWQIVLVGPVVKIDPGTLPHRRNIHYLGQRPYAELPAFLAGWDVCLLPFAINEATRFISPTKVLEYMAAEKPIVSSPVVDVAEPYGHIVHIGADSQSFVRACERALEEQAPRRARRVAMMRRVVDSTSWDATVARMRALVDMAVRQRRRRREATSGRRTLRRRTVVIGAGPTGLSAAYHLGPQNLLLEQNDTVGGWCRSVEQGGFTFDHAGHIMFSNDPYVHEMYAMLLGDNVHWQEREAWIYSKNVYTRYPFQGALHGLPAEVLEECLVGAIEARFGPLKAERPEHLNGGASHACNGITVQNGIAKNGNAVPVPDCRDQSLIDCCADGISESTLGAQVPVRARDPSGKFANFEDFIYGVWGRGVARHFAIPYNRKLWTVPLREMETSWLGGRVPMPDLEEMIHGALSPVARPQGPNARFGYPLHGGFQALMNGFLPQLRGELRLNARVVRVSSAKHQVVLEDGSTIGYEKLVSTMPLPKLAGMLGEELPPQVRKAAEQLRHVSVRCVNLGIGREGLTEKHWIYYPEDTIFHRIFAQGNASPHNNPPGGFGLTCEITYSPHKPLPWDGEELIDRCIADCVRVGIIRADDPILVRNQVDMPYAYVVYDHARAANVELIRDWLQGRDIELAGRYSEWQYYNSDHAFLAGKRVAERIEDALARKRNATAAREVVTKLLGPVKSTVTTS